MSHILFLSYASEDGADSQFKGFFRDLCQNIAPKAGMSSEDERIAFRDRKNLRLGHQWEPELLAALGSSSVMICMMSPGYFRKAFCGKEFYLFDQMRRRNSVAGDLLPPVIIPVIWSPPENIPAVMDEHVWKDDELPDQYEKFGLRDLRFFKPNAYKKAIVALGQSIVKIWRGHKDRKVNGLGTVLDFEHVPNAFGEDEWQEAANGDGWIHGPTVVNVIYGAGTKRTVTLPNLTPKYGDCAREWKPYLPPYGQTISDLTKAAIHDQCMRYREIPINCDLSVVVADPSSLTQAQNQALTVYDRMQPEGTAVLLPWDDKQENQWQSQNIQNAIEQVFPVKSRTPACYRAPILTVDEMRSTLSTTLVEIRDSLTKLETNRKPINDVGPPVVSGAAAAL
jgi:hypothetical protein